MSLGIDIHPYYQQGINWSTVLNASDVEWVYVKASDGGAAYAKTVGGVTYRPDTHVAGAKSVGLPVGVYHYAQFGDPVAQADILIEQHRRLGAALPPMLDLEDPFTGDTAASNFGKAFLNRIAQAGYRPVLYCSSSHAKNMRPDLWGIPGLVVWIASYGPNNGRQNALTGGYPGRVDIHQYTSVGQVAGINANVDLNRGYVALTEEDDMAWDDTFEYTHPDGVTRKVKYGDALLNLWAERFYGSKTDPWTGPSGRAIDLGEAAETPAEVPDEFVTALADELVERGVAGATAEQVQAAVRAAFAKAGVA